VLQEVKLLRYNALNQITLWGPIGEIVDYAAKQWAGQLSTLQLNGQIYTVLACCATLISQG